LVLGENRVNGGAKRIGRRVAVALADEGGAVSPSRLSPSDISLPDITGQPA